MTSLFSTRRAVTLGVGFALALPVFGGGSAENALLLIDPTNPDSLHVGNYYRAARGIPGSNVLYMIPSATNFAQFAAVNAPAVRGTIENLRIDDHVDYIIAAAPPTFFVPAPGLVTDSCSPVTRFSISGVYTMAFIVNEVAAGGLGSTNPNRYYSTTTTPTAFDSSFTWLGGAVGTGTGARRYFIGAALGYTGPRGNTLEEIFDMIDRSVAVDGTRPAGTFYYMHTSDPNRSGPRDGQFPAAVSAIQSLGGQAEIINAFLPNNRQDCLGIMTGAAYPDIFGANIGIVPGAFCDHLTSFAATFDNVDQTKVSAWITQGASGSWGTVEEPCNYPQKFPHPRMHVYYYQGLSLGEATFRSVAATPFQGLLYGDPLTRPFAHLPSVTVPDAPTGVVSGTVTIHPQATTAHPTGAIASLDLLIDGSLEATIAPGGAFTINTAALTDGYHDLRVLAYDNTPAKSVGRWRGSLIVDNDGKAATVLPSVTSGDLGTLFEFSISSTDPAAVETRLVQGSRVLAAVPGSSGVASVFGQTLGAGPVSVQAQSIDIRGNAIRSAPVELQVAASGGAGSQPPVAFSYTKRVRRNSNCLVELPATFGGALSGLSYVVQSTPAQATVPAGQSGPHRMISVPSGVSGSDTMTFRVDSPAGSSATATVTIVYTPCLGDVDNDGLISISDLSLLLSNFGLNVPRPYERGDQDGDRFISIIDLSLLLSEFGTACE